MAERSIASAGAVKLPTGTVTFLLTDLEGSTRLWETDRDRASADVARHYELLDAAIALHGGVRPVEQGEGDSVVGAFATAADALAAALDVQRAFILEPWTEDHPLAIRVGVHTGDALLRDEGNYAGPAVIRCARLRSIAHGGQTVLSDATRELVVDQLPDGAWLRDLGSHRLKDLGRPERVWQLCHGDLVNDFPALRSLEMAATNLPIQLTSFVGRTDELVELSEAMTRSRLVTLTGSGGCGKTRLALQACAELVGACPGGVWWIELAPVSRPELVASAVAATLGVREEHGRPVVDILAEQLQTADALLVLDNCEQVLDATARLVDDLLRAVPNLHVVATSREPLGIGAELGWRVPSLRTDAAVRLFVERSQQLRPSFAPGAVEQEVVAQICDRLDNIPLAIELAAARTRMMSPQRIAEALSDRFRLLTGGTRTVMPRQQTLEASIAWSYDLLDDQERTLLRRLSVFVGGFTLAAAEAVCSDDGLDRYAILELVGRLVDKSLVQVDHDRPQDRYRLLETIRQYARERLAESGETGPTRTRHLAYFLAMAEEAAPEIPTGAGPACLARLDNELDNFTAALDVADADGAHDEMLRLVTALALFFELRGHLGDGSRWFARALESDGPESVVRARALWGAAHVALYARDFDSCFRRAPEALAMAAAVGDTWAEGRALNTFGYAELWFDPNQARATLQRSIALGRASGDDWAVADGLKMLSITWMTQHDLEPARAVLEELHDVARSLDNRFFTAWAHTGFGFVAQHRGELAEARREYLTAMDECRTVGDPATGGIAASWLADVEMLNGDFKGAAARLEALHERRPEADGFDPDEPTLLAAATLALAQGDPGSAVRYLAPLVDAMTTLPLLMWASWSLLLHGTALIALGDDAAADTALERAQGHAGPPLDNPWLSSAVDHQKARLARERRDLSTAENLHHHALARRRASGLRLGVVESIEGLGILAIDQDSFVEGTRLLAVASEQRAAMAYARWPSAQSTYDEQLALARQRLGDDVFAGAWAEGAALTLDDAVGYATRARGERRRPPAGWASLTPTEDRVVAAVAEGLTNPQIADKLFIARGTVKVHLTHIFTKLGVATRSELASQATQRAVAMRTDSTRRA